jgi:hypothetical protein
VEEFYADILARNTADEDSRVLIENQLEKADHRHLGQILTYMAGLDVRTVIWIAESFRSAHLSAIKWLNENTADGFSFFAVRVRAVRIGDSAIAPVFEVLERPNEFERKLHAAAPKSGELSAFGQMRREFWTRYLERHPADAEAGLAVAAVSNNWLKIGAGSPFVVSVYVAQNSVGLFVRGNRGADPAEVLTSLAPYAAAIEARLGVPLEPHRSGYYLMKWRAFSPNDRAQWDGGIDWLHEQAHAYLGVLKDLSAGTL